MLLTLAGIGTLVRLLQPLNADFSILVTPSGIVILVRLLQPRNAESSILFTLPGIVTLVRLVQSLKAQLPMLVTLSGIVILVKLLQPLNAKPSMLVTFFGRITLFRVRSFLKISDLIQSPNLPSLNFRTPRPLLYVSEMEYRLLVKSSGLPSVVVYHISLSGGVCGGICGGVCGEEGCCLQATIVAMIAIKYKI